MRGKEHGEERPWQTWAAILWIVLIALAGGYLLLRYATGIMLPFLIAWGVGWIIHPAAVKLSERTRLPRKLCAVVLMLVLLSLMTVLLILIADRLWTEICHLLGWLESDGERLGGQLEAFLAQMRDIVLHLPLLNRLRRVEGLDQLLGSMDEVMIGLLQDHLRELSGKIPVWIGKLVRAIPSFMIFWVVTLVACFYFSADLQRIQQAILGFLPSRWTEKLPAWKKRLSGLLRQYVRAYLLILMITFIELYIAFSVLGVEYAFLIAGLTALVDILPVFGVGIVLIPWAIVLLIGKRFYVGFGLLITYAIVTVVRQIIEPRVVSGSLGLHPLLTLFCMYVGYRLFGVLGMILAPAAGMLLAGRGDQDQS